MRCNFPFSPNTAYLAASSFYVAAEVTWRVARVFFFLVLLLLGFCAISVESLLFRNFSNEPWHAAPASYVTVNTLFPVATVFFLLGFVCVCFLCGFCGAIAVSAILQIHPAMLHLRSTWRLRLAPLWLEFLFLLALLYSLVSVWFL